MTTTKSTIDITPTAEGCRYMARVCDAEAKRAARNLEAASALHDVLEAALHDGTANDMRRLTEAEVHTIVVALAAYCDAEENRVNEFVKNADDCTLAANRIEANTK